MWRLELVGSSNGYDSGDHQCYLMGGMPRSLQIFFANRSLISLCLGTAER